MDRPATLTVIDIPSNYNILESESGSVFSNRNAGGTRTLFLPENAPNGIYYIFAAQKAYEMRIDPGTGIIRDRYDKVSGKYVWTNYIGRSITLASNGMNEWYPIDMVGDWGREV